MRKIIAIPLLLAAGCAPEIAQDNPQSALLVRFDPSTGAIPLPNDVLRDPDTGKLSIPIDPRSSLAEQQFTAYLNTLTGFPATTPITIPMSGDIAESTLTESTVVVADLTRGVSTAAVRTFDTTTNTILIRPLSGAWEYGHEYAVVIKGGPSGLKGATGQEVAPDAAFYFLRGDKRIDTPENAAVLPGETPIKRLDAARRLETLRTTLMDPALDRITTLLAITREEVAGLATFSVMGETQAVLDLAAAVPQIPMPNDLLRDPVTHLLALPPPTEVDDPSAALAEYSFRRYLNTQDGWLPSQDATVSFTDALDPLVVNNDAQSDLRQRPILVLNTTTGQLVAVDKAPAPDALGERWTLQPAGGGYWKRGHQYIVAVFGDQAYGARDGDARPIVASPTFALLRSTAPLATAQGKSLVKSLTDAQAARLETIRAAHSRAIDTLTAIAGRTRADLALLWSFTISSRTQAALDREQGLTPFPIDLIRRMVAPGQFKIVLPAAQCAAAGPIVCAALQSLDGFSTTGDITVPFTDTIDPTSATAPGAVRLYPYVLTQTTPPTIQLKLDARELPRYVVRSAPAGVPTITLSPTFPLRDGQSYVGIVTRKIRDAEGQPIIPSPTQALLLLRNPLVDAQGHSQIAALADDQALEAEAGRLATNAMVTALENAGLVSRADIALLWTFTTQTIARSLTADRTNIYLPTRPPATAVQTAEIPLAAFSAQGLPVGNLSHVYTGTIRTWITSGPGLTPHIKSATDWSEEVPYLLAVPADAGSAEGGNRVAIFVHGLSGEKTNAMAIANTFAAEKIATIAIDFPVHGERGACEAHADCAAASGAAVCDFTNAIVRRGLPMTPDRPLQASYTGGACACATPGGCLAPALKSSLRAPAARAWGIRLDDPQKIREGLRQAALDVTQMVRVLRAGGIEDANRLEGGSIHLNVAEPTGTIYFAGFALGGIVGNLVGAIEPHIHSLALNAVGGTIVDILSTAPAFAEGPTAPWLTFLGVACPISAPTPAELARRAACEFEAKRTFKWIIDGGDPVNFATRLVDAPLGYDDNPSDDIGPQPIAPKRVLVQECVGDLVVPNETTTRLFDALVADLATRSSLTRQDRLLFSPYTAFDGAGLPAHGFLLSADLSALSRQKQAVAQSELVGFLARGN